MILTLPITPVAWQRVQRGRYGQSFVPTKTRVFKSTIARLAAAGGLRPRTGPVSLRVIFYLPRPKRPKAERPMTRPDVDNYVKAVLDGLNGVAWHDDSQVVTLHAEKHYTLTGKPYLELEILDLIG